MSFGNESAMSRKKRRAPQAQVFEPFAQDCTAIGVKVYRVCMFSPFDAFISHCVAARPRRT
jgi:hypothetical protein